ARQLMKELRAVDARARARLSPLAANLVAAGWRWAPEVAAALGATEVPKSPIAGFEVWRELQHWEDEPDPGKPGSELVGEQESEARLAASIGPSGEERAEQVAYLGAALYAFTPRERVGAPRIALVEAGTGVGKTLGYLAPATLWSEKNGPGLWISTYT